MIPTLKIDVHLNLAGTGTQSSGCFASDQFLRRYTIRFLRLNHRISSTELASTFDQNWCKRLETVVEASPVDYGVVLGFDAVYTKTGELQQNLNQMVVPPEWVFTACKNTKNLLPGPGVNPYRPDALDRLDYCIDHGAVLIKWLPPSQNIDPSDKEIQPFYKKMASAKLPLLVHTGGERTFRSLDHSLGHITKLRLALESGVKVIAAHAATPTLASKDPDQTDDLVKMLREFPNLWVDNSGLCNPGRFLNLPKIAKNPEIVAKTLYGSDWPIPMNAYYFLPQLGWKKAWQLEKLKNTIHRDIEIKKSFGFPDTTLTAPTQVLANLEKWIKKS